MQALAVKVQDGEYRGGPEVLPSYGCSAFPDRIGVSQDCGNCEQLEKCTDYILNELRILRP